MFKLMDGDFPVIVCSVCNQPIYDMWSDQASGSHGGNVVIHHAKCPTTEPLHMTLVEFFGLFGTKNRIGDLGSDGVTDTLRVTFPTNGGFGS